MAFHSWHKNNENTRKKSFRHSKFYFTTLLQSIVEKFPDRSFVIAKNAQFYIQKRPLRFKSENSQILIANGMETWTTHRSRTHLYAFGFEHRGSSIGKSYLLENIDFKEGDVVIDCGANMGDLHLWFKSRNLRVQYIGIEPNPIDFACLSRNVPGNLRPLNLALWNISGELKFWVDSNSASSSLIEPPNYSEIISVKSVRLDELELPQKIKLLKVEGEGAEPEILLGASNILKRIEWISVDVGPERGIEQASTRDDVVTFLTSNSFEIAIENPFHRKTILFRNTWGGILNE